MLNSFVDTITEALIYKFYNLSRYEEKLLRNQSYKSKSIINWKKKSSLKWSLAVKILENLTLIDGQKIREVITNLVNQNKQIFIDPNCYIVAFGGEAKSGGNICYDFRRLGLVKSSNFKSMHELNQIPSNSTIVFVDDLIGTGNQSVKFINEKLNLLLKPSHKTYLLAICGTPEGVSYLKTKSNFSVLTGIELNKESYQFTRDECTVFKDSEKKKLIELNNLLNPEGKNDFNIGLLLAFYNSTPNNCMPIIWKDKFKYGEKPKKKWVALLPRDYDGIS